MSRRAAWAGLSLALVAATSQLAAQTAQQPAITVATQNLRFAHQIGKTAPAPQTIRVVTNPSNLQFTATPASAGGWLLVNNSAGTTGTTGTTTQDVAVSVNPTAITNPGDYTGSITITSGSTSIQVGVVLSVRTTPQVRVDPNLLMVSVEAGTSRTFDIAVSSSDTPITYTAIAAEQTPMTNWLSVSPNVAQTGEKATVTVNAAAIPAGTTMTVGSILFRAFVADGGQVTVPVMVTVTAAPTLTVTPTTVTFPYQIGFSNPTSRAVNVTSSGTQLLYTATVTNAAQPWLTLATAPGAPGTGTISVQNTTPNPIYLIPNIAAVGAVAGTYEAQVRIESSVSVQTVTARLVVTTTPQLTVAQDPQPFAYTLGGTLPSAQSITVGATNGNLPFTVTPVYDAATGGEWFRVTPLAGNTPAALQISVDSTRLSQLAQGSYAGIVRVTSGQTTLDIPVALTVSGSALLTVEPTAIRIQAPQGQTPVERTLIVRSTDGSNQAFTVSVEPATASWLVRAQSSGQTGTTGTVISINVNPNAVSAAGTYEATLLFTPSGVQNPVPFRVPVTYEVTGNASVSVTPERIELTQTGNTPPAQQTIELRSATANLNYIASTEQTWIKLSQTNGSIPGSIRVTFDSASLQPRAEPYAGSIVITVGGVQTTTIPVSLRVQSGATLTVTPESLTFAHTQGTSNPAAKTLQLSSTGAAINFTATATTEQGSWLSVNPTSGATAAQGGQATTLTVNVNPGSLQPGTYRGSIRIDASNASNATTTVNVTLTVSAPAVPQGIVMVSSAAGTAGAVSPGQLVSIYGRNMAPATATYANIVNGVVQSRLGEVRVLFDGIEAPLLYVGPGGGADQINAIVPYLIAGRVSTRMVVEYRGQRSEQIEFRVAETNPGIFTQNSTGAGLGAILNENNSLNYTENAAALGSIIQVYATGEGATTPSGQDGRVIQTESDLRQPVARVSARINGVPADVVYAGSAPSLVSGAFQVNIRIPTNLNISGPAQVPIEIQVGPNVSQRNVTVAVRP